MYRTTFGGFLFDMCVVLVCVQHATCFDVVVCFLFCCVVSVSGVSVVQWLATHKFLFCLLQLFV